MEGVVCFVCVDVGLVLDVFVMVGVIDEEGRYCLVIGLWVKSDYNLGNIILFG